MLHGGQTPMTRRIGCWLPRGTQAWADFTRRTSRRAEDVQRLARTPSWDRAIATAWGR